MVTPSFTLHGPRSPVMNHTGRRVLVLGASRSGKSRFAENLAPASRPCLYIATAKIEDEEMAARIQTHIARRDPRWTTLTTHHRLPETIASHRTPDSFILVDCLTAWLANLLCDHHSVLRETQRLVETIATMQGTLVLVSNEVGAGIVPENQLARRFRDESGTLNQKVAEICDEVILVSAGYPLWIKKRNGQAYPDNPSSTPPDSDPLSKCPDTES